MKKKTVAVLFLVGVLGSWWFIKKFQQPRYHIIISCHITDLQGKILRNFPGFLCGFFDNGDYVLNNSSKGLFKYFNKRNDLVWEKKEALHHKLAIAKDESRIYYISSEFTVSALGEQIRWDRISVIRRDGTVIATNSMKFFWDIIEQYHPTFAQERREVDWLKLDKKTYEYTHCNTFHEIGENELMDKVPWLARGNYLVGTHRNGEMILFLDASLQKVLKVIKLDDIFGFKIDTHDLQILKNGNLLIYANKSEAADSKGQAGLYSNLIEYSFTANKIVWKYEARPRLAFYSPRLGGVTITPEGLILFSDITAEEGWVRWINRKGEIKRQWPVPFNDPVTKRPATLQEARVKDLTLFLRNNKGL